MEPVPPPSPDPPSSSARPAARAFPGILQALWLILLIWLGGLVAAVALGIATIAITGEVFDTADPLLLILFNGFGFSLALLLGVKLTGAGFRRVFPLGGFPAVILVPLALVCLSGVALTSEIDNLFRLLPAPEWLRAFMEMVDETILDMLRKNFAVALVATVIMAPLTEELFFRGLLLFGFLRRYGSRKAILASAVLFAVAHFTPNQFLIAVFGGILLGWLFVRTGSLWPPIIAHAFVNGLSMTAAGIALSQGAELTDPPTFLPWWLTLGAVLVLLLSLRWLRRILPSAPLSQTDHT